MPTSCHFRDCKALLVTSLTHVGGVIASVCPDLYLYRNRNAHSTLITGTNPYSRTLTDPRDEEFLSSKVKFSRTARILFDRCSVIILFDRCSVMHCTYNYSRLVNLNKLTQARIKGILWVVTE